jgi:aminopeptidase YwaD
MNKLSLKGHLLALALLWVGFAGCSPGFYPAKTGKTIKDDVGYLASDALQGRKSGEKGDSLAAIYIRNRFMDDHLKLLYDKGFQPFSLIANVTLGTSNQLSLNDREFQVSKDFLPYSFSSDKSFSGEIAFAGYGFEIQSDTLQWNDYAGIDATGKWILLLKGDPEINQSQSIYEPYSDVRAKVLVAIDHHAGGVLLAGGPGFSENDQLESLFYDKNSSTYSIPVMQISRAAADVILSGSQVTIAQLEQLLNSSRVPHSFIVDGRINGRADVIQQKVQTNNIVGLLRGTDPVLKNEYVVVGAHYDHLGWGGPGSGSRAADTLAIHNGADDNASGVAAMLEIAGKASEERKNRRSLIFAAFGAEEMGLIGSKTFTDNPPVDLKKVTAMINLDMVGRLDSTSNSLSIGGTLTSKESEEILTRMNKGFNLAFSGEGFGPSDHASFYIQNIPVLFFSTGAHPDYHTPGDKADKINYTGLKKVADYGSSVITEIANRENRLTFQEAGSKMQRSRGGRFKVTLGIMPDYAGMEKRGLRVDAVTKGKPAEHAGMLKGDIITAIDGKPVGNIYDYMNRLKTFSMGQIIAVDIIRNEQPMSLIVHLY